ncbi:MAG: DUF4270 family protein [Bacteroidota bacterium]
MKKILFALVLALPVVFWSSSCTKPTLVGSELLNQDEADLRFTDTLTLRAQTIREDSIQTFNLDNPFNSFPCGFFQDPLLGTVRAEIYAQFREGSLDPPLFENPRLDSLVLTLAIDTLGTYGRFNEPYEFEVRRIVEELDSEAEYFSDQTFDLDATVLGSKVDEVDLEQVDSFVLNVQGEKAGTRFVEIRLDDQLGMDMFDTTWYEEGAFIEQLRGLHISIANSTPTEGILNFDMNADFTRLRLFYRNFTAEPDTVPSVYDFTISGVTIPRHVFLEHDFSTGIVEEFFDDPSLGDSLVFIQSMAGPNVELDIPHFGELGNIVVNKAELEFFAAVLPTDNELVYPADLQLIVAAENEDGELLVIDDVLLNALAFGGAPVEEEVDGQMMIKYNMNIAAYLNTLLADGRATSPKLILRSAFKQERSNRLVLFGPGHSRFPAKLNLTYTNIDN